MESARKKWSATDRAGIASAIRAFVESEAPPTSGARLEETSDLVNEWFVDSMTIVNVVAFLEEEFGIQVRRADINGKTFRSLRTLTDYVAARLG